MREQTWQRYREEVAAEIERLLSGRQLLLYHMVRYHLGWEDAQGAPLPGPAGRLNRPLLCLLSCQAVDGDYRRALPAAAAVELLHNFSLVHDDIQDRSPTRRHRRTVWQIWGEGQAINAGDALFALAHLAAQGLVERGASPREALQVLALLDRAALTLCEGQVRDLSYEERREVSLEDYLAMARAKAGSLLGAAAASGSLLGGAREAAVEAFWRFGEELGIALQVHDDLLGLWGRPEVTGKPVGDDIRARKKGFPIVWALAQAPPALRQALDDLYSRPRLGAREEGRILALLEEAGARREAQRMVGEQRRRALTWLEGLALSPEGRGELEAFTLHLLSA